MTATISTLRAGLATALGAISGLKVYSVWPDQINQTPCALIRPTQGMYHEAMGTPGYQEVTFEVTILANATQKGVVIGQPLLDDYLDVSSTNSVKAAIELDPTLGGVADSLIVSGWSQYGSLAIGEVEFIGAVVTVTVEPEVTYGA